MRHLPLYIEPPQAIIATTAPMPVDHACALCELHEVSSPRTVCMAAEGTPGGVLLIAEMPGRVEDMTGRPFTGGSGKYLRGLIKRWWSGPVAFDNAVRCCPGRTEVKSKHIDACRGFGAQIIREVQPQRIVCLGKQAIEAVTGRSPAVLSVRRGYSFLFTELDDAIPVFYTVNPAAALRNRFVKTAFEGDLHWALTCQVPVPDFSGTTWLVDTADDAEEAWESLVSACVPVTYDVETSGQMHNADFRLESVTALADNSNTSYTWTRSALLLAEARVFLRMVLDTCHLDTSNGKYDDQSTRLGVNALCPHVRLDARLIRKMVDVDVRADLATMGEMVGLGGHKNECEDRLDTICRELRRQANPLEGLTPTGKVRKIKPPAFPISAGVLEKIHAGVEPMAYAMRYLDPKTLYRYNARDVYVTRAYIQKYEPTFRADKNIMRMWDLVVRDANKAVRQMELWGIAVDRRAIDLFNQYCDQQIADTWSRIRLYTGDDFNPNSALQVRDLLFTKLGLTSIKKTKGDADSTDSEVLDILAKKHPVAKDLKDHRHFVKMKGTYAEGLLPHIREDGRVHPSFLLDGAGTGRMSCLTGSTRVRTSRGTLPISLVEVGDYVWTHHERWRCVTGVLYQGIKPVENFTLSNGTILTGTIDHRVLTLSGQWRQIGEIAHEHLAQMAGNRRESCCGNQSVPRHEGNCHSANDCRRLGNDVPYRVGNYQGRPGCGGTPCASSIAVLGIEDWREESDAGEVRRSTPQLEGDLRGRARLSDMPLARQEAIRASCGDGEDAGVAADSGNVGRASYRWEPAEQRPRQSGIGNSCRTHGDSLLAGEGGIGVVLTAYDAGGDHQVFDLMVDEDHSFLAEGIFVHNCTEPNLQNVPRARGSIEGKLARDCFVARQGWLLLEADFSQLELRVAAMLSQDNVMIDDFKNGIDIHRNGARECCFIWGLTVAQWDALTKDEQDPYRSQIKGIIFGKLYGKKDKTIASDFGVDISVVVQINSKIWGRYKKLARWCSEKVNETRSSGESWTWWAGKRGRRRPLWRIADEGDDASASRSNAENAAINTPVQGTAADFCTASLWILVSWIIENAVPALIVGAVHDSIMLEVREDALHEVALEVRRVMTSHDSGGVPLVVDVKYGPAWGSLKDLVL